jgi:hypothetical protein
MPSDATSIIEPVGGPLSHIAGASAIESIYNRPTDKSTHGENTDSDTSHEDYETESMTVGNEQHDSAAGNNEESDIASPKSDLHYLFFAGEKSKPELYFEDGNPSNSSYSPTIQATSAWDDGLSESSHTSMR